MENPGSWSSGGCGDKAHPIGTQSDMNVGHFSFTVHMNTGVTL